MRRLTLVVVILLVASALASAQRLARPNPETERANSHYLIGLQHLQHEAWEDAVREFQAAIDIDPNFKLAYYGEGRAYMPMRRYVDAIKAYAACRDLYVAAGGQKFTNQLDAQRMRQDEVLALRELIRISGSGPQTIQAQNTQRQLENRLQTLQDTINRGYNISFQSEVPAFVSVALGSAYFRAERLVDAEREYKAAIDADDKAGEAHNNLAVVYMLTDRLAESEREMKLAEKSGFRVRSEFKQDLADRRKQKP